jgi:ABC-type antimicrobial peptide transport system permease subunit
MIFAAAALFLAAAGIYAVISYTVTQRRQEIGIRMALGAQQSDVLKLIVGQGMIKVLLGEFMGLIAAFILTRLVSSLLFQTSPTDPMTFALIAGLLTSVALLACCIPALRATRIDPTVALRTE